MEKNKQIIEEEEEEINYDENSEFWVNKILDETKDENGNIHRKTIWEKHDGDLNLGSLNKPQNRNIIGFEWRQKGIVGEVRAGDYFKRLKKINKK